MKHEPGMAYDTKILNRVFAFVSLILMVSVLWMMLEDYIRPWKKYQIEALAIKREVLNKKIEELKKEVDQGKLEELQQELVKARAGLEGKKQQIQSIEDEVTKLNGIVHLWTMKKGEANAQVAALTFNQETKAAHGDPTAKVLKKKLDQWKVTFADASDTLKKYELERKQKIAEMKELRADVDATEKAIDEQVGAVKRLEVAKSKSSVDPVSVLRNLPFLDYLDPTIKIRQVVLNNIKDDRYFQQVAKVDRCMTCHVNIDQAGFEDQPQPFKTHSNLSLMVGPDSKHPMKEYGCTACHGGEGHRVHDFASAAHTPNDEKQAQEWKEKHGWHEPHKVAKPMYRLKYIEAGCLNCHKGVERIPEAHKLNKGRALIEQYGCNACHKIAGWEHKDAHKHGPSLYKIAAKIDKNFAKNWIWAPHSFNPMTKMPSFFNRTNNSNEDFRKKNVAEVNSIVEYLWEKSKAYRPKYRYGGGDSENGKELISKVGCIGCHQVDGVDESFQKADTEKGPRLVGLGSKLDGDWLVTWLREPHHYDPSTVMPSFRLTEQEAADITAFLLDSKKPSFERMKLDKLDGKVRDELLVTYFAAFDTIENAQRKVESMSERERTMELGKRSIGKYGCASCHSIDGHETAARIGPELTNVGSKPEYQLGFGHEKLPHKLDVWLYSHLQDPRRWDKGVNKSFSDILKMPQFMRITDEEIEAIVVNLMGQVEEKLPLEGQYRPSSDEVIVERGMRVVRQKNCVGCHKIDGEGGTLTKNYEDDLNEAPPYLVEQGQRVKAKWFYHFLDNVEPIRPWLTLRMPSFKLTNEEKNAIVDMFRVKAGQVLYDDETPYLSWHPGEREAAIKLFKRLECTTCHTHGFNDETPMGPNLGKAKGRLRASWIKKWLKNPAKILPYTTMPTFWEDGVENPAPDILDGDEKRQIEALTKYVLELSKKTDHRADLTSVGE